MDSRGGGSSGSGGSGDQGRSNFYTPEQRAALMYVNRLRYENVQERGLERYISDNGLGVMQRHFDGAEAAMEGVRQTLSDVVHAGERRDQEAHAEAATRHHQAVAEWVDRGTVFHERARRHLDARDEQQGVTQRNATQPEAAERQMAQQPAAPQFGAGGGNPLAQYQADLWGMYEDNAARLAGMEADQPPGQSQWPAERFAPANAVMSGGLVDPQPADEQFLSAEDYASLFESMRFDAAAPAQPSVDQAPMTPGIAAPVPVFQPPMDSGILATAPVPAAQANVAQALAGEQNYYGRQPRNPRVRTDNAGNANGSGNSYANAPHRPSSSTSPRRSSSPGR
ncbi:hypothetical protein [Streptomyces axinellae]|uniref:Uncharacterized protein n=1 Tax=Streptomyces axinellae TaxID=552788 RepID=A0ABP6CHP0_9ACTN